ncbi:efflux RND transporter periplasmic adaptor subunit [Microbispora bryophytorum]|uniref:Efflux RND transporter periplasmic adaptor subunit n=1 Tax=Microbispora bryophytorum subsp. camponoti TaxID=1677852 RepID=A0ABR8LAL6_9ACTN|nr:efflux RND transporter periplasmic adaptor subunit [Microbispora camponoti]MBD3146505.1 efflux RND transporter periplasmic adaptor subunit [Microbispora camponoti]
MRPSTPLSVGGLALAGIVIASVAVISATGGDTSVADRIALASVKRGTVASYVSAAGNTIDTGVRDLAFGAEGTVEKVYVKVGQKVRRGKVLAQIDDTIAKENYEAAKAALAAAQETLDDVENGTATTGVGAASGAGGSGAGAFGGGTGSGGTGGARPPGGGTGGGAGAGNSGRAGAGAGAGNADGSGPGSGNAGGAGAGAGAGNAGGSGSGTSTGGGGPVACPTPSVRPSGQVTTRPSSQPWSRSSATARPSSRPAAAAANTGASAANTGASASAANTGASASAANTGASASAASIGLVAYRGGDHGGANPQPGPAPTATPRPHPKPSRPHRPARPHGASAPNPEVSVSILPTAPSRQPSATPSPSGGSSSACSPGQGGQGQGGQGQGSQGQGGQSQGGQGQGGQGQGSQGQGGGAHRRAGFGGGQTGQSGQGAQAGQGGQGGQGGQRGQGGARLTEAEAEAQVSQATSELAEAKEALAGVRIKAPADGTVMSVAGTVGSRYASGTFITLGDLDDLQVQAMFTESDIRFLKVGQAATVTLATRPGQEYPGTVAHIDPTATTSNRLVRYGVTIVLNSRPARLLLGQTATVRVTTGQAADALYLPSQAVRAQGDGTAVVTVADGGTHSPRTVKVGVRGDSYVEITGGLSEGDQVVLPGASTAFPDEGFPAAR